MLSHLRIQNVALISELEIEFGTGLNLLTGETGSGKSIIVDSLETLIGDRASTDLIKQGADTAKIEGLFTLSPQRELLAILEENGIDTEAGDEIELIVRRDISLAGKNRVFVNGSLVTQGFLKRLGGFLADIHGQGEQATLYDTSSHLAMLDDFADDDKELAAVAKSYTDWSAIREQLDSLEQDESEKLQLIDILKFQVEEISRAGLVTGEDAELEEEKLKLNNVERLSTLSAEVQALLYDDELSSLATLDRATKLVQELAQYDARFRGFEESLDAARAVASELGSTARDFGAALEFSPERLDEIENRLAEIARLKRKYGESIDAILRHLETSRARLESIETAGFREEELRAELARSDAAYRTAAGSLSAVRAKAGAKLGREVEAALNAVALDKAKFEVRIEDAGRLSPRGMDRVEFLFSANPGEAPKPLSKVASGGEASRLMLVLKTVAHKNEGGKTAVFDEIDIGIGGRVAEAVGRKLKSLAATSQVLCVTHQPQIASLADRHFIVEKATDGKATSVTLRELDEQQRVDEIARMLAGEQITEAARENARAMLAGK